MNGLSVTNGNMQAMSSLEIAELTGKQHYNVMRDIRTMFTELYGEGGHLNYEASYLNEQNKAQPCFHLPKRESLILVSGYSATLRAKIIDRWQELEAKAPPVDLAAMLNDPAAMRGLLLGYTEKVLELQHQVEELTPKADFYDGVAASDDTYSVAQVAKILRNTGQNRLYQWLRNAGLVNRNNEPYQRFVDMGVLTVKVTERLHPTTGQTIYDRTTRVTGKGLVYIRERFCALAVA